MQTTANSIKRCPNTRAKRSWGHRALASVLALAAVLVVLTAAWLLMLAWVSAHASVAAPGPSSTDELLALGAATVAVSIALWLCVGVALEALSHLPGRVGRVAGGWAERLTPALARRVAAFIVGVGVGVAGGPPQAAAQARPATTAASVATATEGVPADPGFTVSDTSRAVDPGFVPTVSGGSPIGSAGPDAPTGSAGPDFGALVAPSAVGDPPVATPPVAPGFTPTAPVVRPQADPGLIGARPAPATEREVVVHRGDSLWSIAARHLGPDASDAEIAREWPRWFEANRDRIGDDPDLILPGQLLHLPDDHHDHHDHDHDHDQRVSVTP